MLMIRSGPLRYLQFAWFDAEHGTGGMMMAGGATAPPALPCHARPSPALPCRDGLASPGPAVPRPAWPSRALPGWFHRMERFDGLGVPV
jgi:hypothetical protein